VGGNYLNRVSYVQWLDVMPSTGTRRASQAWRILGKHRVMQWESASRGTRLVARGMGTVPFFEPGY
jgi:hypothetical protein